MMMMMYPLLDDIQHNKSVHILNLCLVKLLIIALSSLETPLLRILHPSIPSGKVFVYIMVSSPQDAHFIDYNNIRLEHDEHPEDLFQHLMSFVEDNLLIANGSITHHSKSITTDEELTLSLENVIVLTWLRLIHSNLPNLVKQRYGTELHSRTLASLKPEIFQALDSLLDELCIAADSKVQHTAVSRFKLSLLHDSNRPPTPSRLTPTRRPKSCPLCKEADHVEQQHYLSKCPNLPPEDSFYFTKN